MKKAPKRGFQQKLKILKNKMLINVVNEI